MIINQSNLFVKSIKVFLSTLVISLLSACGGGGGSTSGSGGSIGSSGSSSTLVLDVRNIDSVAAIVKPEPLQQTQELLISRLLEFALSNSWASHTRVLLNGTDFGQTSNDESFQIAVTAGTYEVTFVADDPDIGSCSTDLAVGDDQIIYLDNIEINDPGENCFVSYDKSVENVDEDLIAGGDNAPNGKTLVCHKGKKSIGVSTRSVSAHLKHGDVTGPCQQVASSDEASDDDSNSEDGSSDDGNDKPGKPDKPEKPGKPS
ncbi:MAG: hypothetical protein WBM41_15105 [Arenicellales bacterium]